MERVAVVPALATAEVLKQSGLAASTLNYWIRQGIVGPSVIAGQGQRYDRYWSVPDAVAVRAVKQLRDGGCPMKVVETVRDKVDEALVRPDEVLLYWTGAPPLRLATKAQVRRIPVPNVAATHAVFAPVTQWRKDAEGVAVNVDPVEVRDGRDKRRDGRPVRAPVEEHPDS